MTKISSVYVQMSQASMEAVAIMLGFCIDETTTTAAGFYNTLREIPPLPAGFTIGDVLNAYLLHLLNKNFARHVGEQGEAYGRKNSAA
jgi:hypothetical protein